MLKPNTAQIPPAGVVRPAGRAERLPGRTARDWYVEVAFVCVAAGLGCCMLLATVTADPPVPSLPLTTELIIMTVVCLLMLGLRRSHPVALALGLVVVGPISAAAFGAIAVAIFTVAVRRAWPFAVSVSALHGLAVAGLFRMDSTPRQYWESVITILLLYAALTASGMLVRSQRLLVRSLQDRARQTEEQQRLRIEEARRLERERIAREMHDALAHRISLLAVHAGALEYRPGAPAAEATRAARVIRSCAYEVQEDLREVIRLLRTGSDDGEGERPQPTLADLDDLVEETRRTGTPVTYGNALGADPDVPPAIARHAYRILQEGLTNARKHAPGAPVQVSVAGARGAELTVEVRNPLPPGTTTALPPGSGAGIIGLRERVDLVGGRLAHGTTPDGEYRLWAWLPWRM